MTFLKRNWLSLLLAVVCVALTVTVVNQNRQLTEQADQIQTIWGQLRQDVSDIYHLQGDVEELKPAASLVQAFSVTVADVDTVRQQVVLNLTVTPAEGAQLRYPRVTAHRSEGDPAHYLWPSADLREKNGLWEGELTLPVDETSPVTLSLLTGPHAEPAVETLAEYPSMTALLPVVLANHGGEAAYDQAGDGKLYFVHLETELTDPAGNPVVVEEPRYRVYRNGELALEVSALDYEIEGKGVAADPGDQMELNLTCRDAYGLSYEFALRRWEIGPDWRVRLIEQWRPAAYPAVVWPG